MEVVILRFLAVACLGPATIFLLYNLFLMLFSIGRARRADTALADHALPRFAVVIPAHDEEDSIGTALDGCDRFDYPPDRFEVVVVADNCTDRTAQVVRARGTRCLERNDRAQRGKGFALRFAFDQLLEEDFDALLVLDADCVLDPQALREFAAALALGHRVIQANYVVSNPDASSISYALAVGNVIENDLYYWPKSRLGLVVALRGTGMVFAADVLRRKNWHAYSVVEDLDYSLALYDDGETVHFLRDTHVRSAFPETLQQLRIQRRRWAGGNAQMGRGQALRTLVTGLVTARPRLVDAAMTIFSQSRPLQLLLVVLGTLIAGLGSLATSDPWLGTMWRAGLWIAAGYGLYLFAGVLRLGLSPRRLRLLLATAGVFVQLTSIAVVGLLSRGPQDWARTPRS